MTDNISSLADLLAELDKKKCEIDALTAQINAMVKSEVDKAKLHNKRVIKQGMESFFSGNRKNPFPETTEDAELWDYGYNLSKDNWDEVKK